MDFQFLQNPISKKWVISAPRRAKRPDVARGSEPICPFCPGPFGSALASMSDRRSGQGKQENLEEEVYRVPTSVIASTFNKLSTKQSQISGIATSQAPRNDDGGGWQIRVLKNKFPFAPIHQVIIHSPDHHKNFDQLSLKQVQLILETYRHQYNEYTHKGQVYIFHNRGEAGGESLPHPHSQLAVVPFEVRLDIPRLDPSANAAMLKTPFVIATQSEAKGKQSLSKGIAASQAPRNDMTNVQTKYFSIFCPEASQWPDEVWVAPKKRGRAFGEITNAEIVDLSHILQRLIQIFDLRHGNNFPFNFYIYPGGDWYLRIIPRLKVLGGFELGTGIYVNTQKPEETLAFIKEHFGNTDQEKIKQQHQAEYEVRA